MKNLSPKEAAEVLEDMKVKIEIPKAAVTQRKRNTALDMAIEALNCSEIPNNSDIISRQQAIDALEQLVIPEDMCVFEILSHIELVIGTLPSTQPERKMGHWIPVTNGRGGHQCDRCGSYAPSYQSGAEWLSNFCPECNADMRGKAE